MNININHHKKSGSVFIGFGQNTFRKFKRHVKRKNPNISDEVIIELYKIHLAK